VSFDSGIICFISVHYIGELLPVPSHILLTPDFHSSRHVGLKCQGQKGDPKGRNRVLQEREYKATSTGYIQVTHHVDVTVREFLGCNRARDD
jgi:hypothetical protein